MIFIDKFRDKLCNRWSWLRLFAIGMTLVVLGHVLVQTVRDLETYPGIDLRVKVVSSRLLARGMNPYYDFRHVSQPAHLQLPSDDTYSPVLLLMYEPLSESNWRMQRAVYFLVDWSAILLCSLVLSRVFPKGASRTALWIAFVLLFIAAFGFRLHLERGQYYVELALLTALASASLLRRQNQWFHAWPLALLVLLRPTYAICLVVLLFLRRVRYAVYAAGIGLLLFAATLPLVGVGDWGKYLAAVHADERATLDAVYGMTPESAAALDGQTMDGIDFSRSLAGPAAFVDCTLVGLARGSVSPVLTRLVHRIAPTENRFERLNTGCLLSMLIFNLTVLYGFWRSRAQGPVPIAFAFLAPLNLELFAPQHFGYCDVLLLAPLLLMLASVLSRGSRGGWFFYGALLAVGFLMPWAALRWDWHVQLFSFLQYVGLLAILNGVCLAELRRRGEKAQTCVVPL